MKRPRSLEFERYLRNTMPRKLNLSDAKSAAVERIFYGFADALRPLESRAPDEFSFFIDEFIKKIEKTNKARCPKNCFIENGHYVQLSNSQIKAIEENKDREKQRPTRR